MLKLGIGIDNLHGAPSEDKAGTDEERVAEGFGCRQGFAFIGGYAIGRLGNVQLVEHYGKELAILGDLNALRRGADDIDAVFLQAKREVKRRLAAELSNSAPAFLAFV